MALGIRPHTVAVSANDRIERLLHGDVLTRNAESFLILVRAGTRPFQTRKAKFMVDFINVEFGPASFDFWQVKQVLEGEMQVSFFHLKSLNPQAQQWRFTSLGHQVYDTPFELPLICWIRSRYRVQNVTE